MNKVVQQPPNVPATETHTREDVSQEKMSGRDIMQSVLSKPSRTGKTGISRERKIDGIVIGTLSGTGENGQPLILYPGMPVNEALPAISTVSIKAENFDSEVALSFLEGDPDRPLILGFINKGGQEQSDENDQANVYLDGERLVFSAEREIVLKCGKSSITLTKAGKIILKGSYLSNHSTGVNRIKGGSVQIN